MYYVMMAAKRPDFSREAAMTADQPGAGGTSALGDNSGDGEKSMDSREI